MQSLWVYEHWLWNWLRCKRAPANISPSTPHCSGPALIPTSCLNIGLVLQQAFSCPHGQRHVGQDRHCCGNVTGTAFCEAFFASFFFFKSSIFFMTWWWWFNILRLRHNTEPTSSFWYVSVKWCTDQQSSFSTETRLHEFNHHQKRFHVNHSEDSAGCSLISWTQACAAQQTWPRLSSTVIWWSRFSCGSDSCQVEHQSLLITFQTETIS